jgi:hypothetical protein
MIGKISEVGAIKVGDMGAAIAVVGGKTGEWMVEVLGGEVVGEDSETWGEVGVGGGLATIDEEGNLVGMGELGSVSMVAAIGNDSCAAVESDSSVTVGCDSCAAIVLSTRRGIGRLTRMRNGTSVEALILEGKLEMASSFTGKELSSKTTCRDRNTLPE